MPIIRIHVTLVSEKTPAINRTSSLFARIDSIVEPNKLNRKMFRIGSPDWGSKLIDCGSGGLEVHGGEHPWGYAAEMPLSDVVRALDPSHSYVINITVTLIAGTISIGLRTATDEFIKQHHTFPKNQTVIWPLPVDVTYPDLFLIVRNGAVAHSVVRIQDIALERHELFQSIMDRQVGQHSTARSSVQSLDDQNAGFWSELCGSKLARYLGISDYSPSSLRRFDDYYFNWYPYLFVHIPFTEMAGLDVLEAGLGYGTVSQRLAEWGARFTGLDISPGPVAIVNGRLRQIGLPGQAILGSIVDAPFANESFDRVVTIGCLHHTGDLAKSIEECWRILKPGGKLIMMVYNAYSLRRWMEARNATAGLWVRERLGYRGALALLPGERKSYDTNEAGDEAPHLDVVSITSLRHLCRKFSEFSYLRENIFQEKPFAHRTRNELLKTLWPRIAGTDIYVTATKQNPWYRASL
jgi:SAM-dependent methyltransferase